MDGYAASSDSARMTQTGPKLGRNPAAQRTPDMILANPLWWGLPG